MYPTSCENLKFITTSTNIANALIKDTENIDSEEKGIIVTSGSQQALYSLGKILVTPGETAITEAPYSWDFLPVVSQFSVWVILHYGYLILV